MFFAALPEPPRKQITGIPALIFVCGSCALFGGLMFLLAGSFLFKVGKAAAETISALQRPAETFLGDLREHNYGAAHALMTPDQPVSASALQATEETFERAAGALKSWKLTGVDKSTSYRNDSASNVLKLNYLLTFEKGRATGTFTFAGSDPARLGPGISAFEFHPGANPSPGAGRDIGPPGSSRGE